MQCGENSTREAFQYLTAIKAILKTGTNITYPPLQLSGLSGGKALIISYNTPAEMEVCTIICSVIIC